MKGSEKAVKTFENQAKLPRLPIPPLLETAQKHLKSVKPLLSVEEYARAEKVIQDFVKPGGLGEKLQQRLVAYDKTQPFSWLEYWWYAYAYHSWREPLVVNVNWVAVLKNHPHHPKDLLNNPSKSGQYSSFQIERAAGIINLAINYKEMIDSYVLNNIL
jgi:carnitine O-acetyltransferase